ncbi:MAG: ATP synthase F1 subunit gamma [Oscillibacter sp.]|nr:ATP synthase F1 subunit gamma [Oscillibacter sp.]
MSNVKELKARIEGVQETRKITNAMYLVASTKLRHAREALDRTRPYFDAMRQEVGRVFRTGESAKSRYFYSPEGKIHKHGVCGILVITADKGLAGAYNLNAIRKAEALLDEQPDARLFVVGEYGRRHFRMRRRPFETEFRYTAQDPTFNRAREICTKLLDLYDKKELNEIVVVYTEMKSSLSTETMTQRLLPMEREPFQTGEPEEGEGYFEFLPSFDAVLSAVMRSYISGFVYSALVDSFCSEQNSRVTAMDAAGRNAEELLSDLSLQLNRERQSAITQEITEISAGAMAQRRNNRKEASD